jgi:hypothetical protein
LNGYFAFKARRRTGIAEFIAESCCAPGEMLLVWALAAPFPWAVRAKEIKV